jgi:hypothetical protein
MHILAAGPVNQPRGNPTMIYGTPEQVEQLKSDVVKFSDLTTEGKLSALYGQILEAHTKINDILARLAKVGPAS